MDYYKNLAEMYVGDDVSPDFYGWVFPKYDHVAVGAPPAGLACSPGSRLAPHNCPSPDAASRSQVRPRRTGCAPRPKSWLIRLQRSSQLCTLVLLGQGGILLACWPPAAPVLRHSRLRDSCGPPAAPG